LPAHFRIYPEHHLVFSRYSGTVVIDEYISTVEGIAAHPDFNIHYKHLIDLGAMTKIKREYLKVMRIQARIAELVTRSRTDIMNVVIAPTPVALDAANMALRSWERLDTKVVGRIVTDMSRAAVLLGLPHDTLLALQREIA
jgi:hypothetical protein